MKKLAFCLCLILLCSCAQRTPAATPEPDGAPQGASLAAAPKPDDTPEPSEAPAESGGDIADEPGVEKIPMIMLGGEIYCDTGEVSDMPRCGMMDGEITSSVERWEEPAEDGQSNFGSGYGWQYGPGDGTRHVRIDDEWHIFQKRSELSVKYHDTWYDAEDLSGETLQWLLWFNSLPEEEQLAVSFVPLDLYELCGYPLAGDIEAVEAEG